MHVTAEHLAAAVAGVRYLLNFAGYCVSSPHKAIAARQCDELLPHARAGSVVNTVRIEPDCPLIKETFEEGPYLRLEARC
jgi:shikimate 5-dehydrogenase